MGTQDGKRSNKLCVRDAKISNIGYCKYKERCKKQHVKEKWKALSALQKQRMSQKRHIKDF